MVKVNKSRRTMQSLNWMKRSRWCEGCEKPRSMSSKYWKALEEELIEVWKPYSFVVGSIEQHYQYSIMFWASGLLVPKVPAFREFLNWCPECQIQYRWERTEKVDKAREWKGGKDMAKREKWRSDRSKTMRGCLHDRRVRASAGCKRSTPGFRFGRKA